MDYPQFIYQARWKNSSVYKGLNAKVCLENNHNDKEQWKINTLYA